MKKCPKCGTQNELNALFCGECGTHLEIIAPRPPVSTSHDDEEETLLSFRSPISEQAKTLSISHPPPPHTPTLPVEPVPPPHPPPTQWLTQRNLTIGAVVVVGLWLACVILGLGGTFFLMILGQQ